MHILHSLFEWAELAVDVLRIKCAVACGVSVRWAPEVTCAKKVRTRVLFTSNFAVVCNIRNLHSSRFIMHSIHQGIAVVVNRFMIQLIISIRICCPLSALLFCRRSGEVPEVHGCRLPGVPGAAWGVQGVPVATQGR